MVDAGLIVLVSFISPFRAERRLARELAAPTMRSSRSSSTRRSANASARDPKGLYHKARVGELRNFTGIDSAYEPPEAPDLHLPTLEMTIDGEVERVIEALQRRGVFD